MAATFSTSFAGAKVQAKAPVATKARKSVVVTAMLDRRAVAGAAAALVVAFPMVAKADLVDDLLAKSVENKELHNKQRLASSYANFARSRTVADKSCSFPNNFLGCDIGKYAGDVKYISDEQKIECAGTKPGLCAGNMNATKYSK